MRVFPSLGAIASLSMLASCASTPPDLNDNRVVPGERVGAIELGMTLPELLSLMGTPTKTVPINGTAATTYSYDGITIAAHDEVYWIIVTSPIYSTYGGVSIGDEQIYARAQFGKPECVVTKGDTTVYDYDNYYFMVSNGTGLVSQMGIQRRTQNCA